MANISLFGANYTDVPAVDLPKTGGGTARFHEVSGSQTITQNNTYDVTNLAQVVVSVSGGSPTLETVTKTYTPTTSQQTDTITPSTGYDGISEVDVTINAMPSGSATPASSISATGATVTTGTNTLTLSKSSVSNTPQVSAGYISSGTSGNSSVSLTASVTTKGATNYYATTSDQTIASGTYLTGTQTIKALSQTNLTAENIKSGTTIKINNGNADVWSVLGTYSGGGGASNIRQGTFTTGSTGSGTATFDTGYSGSGYPIAMFIYVDGGTYNNGTGGNTAWYNSVTRYDCGWYAMVKSRTTTTPTYGTSGADNYGTVAIIYKNSTSNATTYTRTSSMTANTYSSSNAGASTACARFKGNNHTVSYYVGNATSSTIGFPKSTKMAYIVVYSS